MPKASRKVTLGGGLGIWGTGFALGAAIILGVIRLIMGPGGFV